MVVLFRKVIDPWGGAALLEEALQWEGALRAYSLGPLPVLSVLPDLSLGQHHLPLCASISQDLGAKMNPFFLRLLLVRMFYHSNRDVPNTLCWFIGWLWKNNRKRDEKSGPTEQRWPQIWGTVSRVKGQILRKKGVCLWNGYFVGNFCSKLVYKREK